MIGNVKMPLKRVLGKRVVHFMELGTLIAEVEKVINNRPLTHISDNSNDPLPVTPKHFLRPTGHSLLPEADVIAGSSHRAAFRKLQRLREMLQARFRMEYLGQLVYWHNRKTTPLKIGDVVLVEHDNIKRQDWAIAVVIEELPGTEGVTRTFRLRYKGGELLRSAQRLYLLEAAVPPAVYQNDDDRVFR